MSDEKKKSYPKIPMNNWFLLRDKFKQRTPETVTPSYVASALSMGEASARANIIPPLRTFGLIDDSGKPTDLAYDWRDDGKYSEVCKAIVESTYPQELLDLFPDASADLKEVASWFARDAKVGESAARAYSATYAMLMEADLERAKERIAKPRPSGSVSKPRKKVKVPSVGPEKDPKGSSSVARSVLDAQGDAAGVQRRGFSPKLHVDIQIHISPESSPEQIEKIFESMAKHLPFKS